MSSSEFEQKWSTKFAEMRSNVLLWEKPFRPKTPEIINEESVVAYVKVMEPSQRRAKIKLLSLLDWVCKIPFVILLSFCNVFIGIGPMLVSNIACAGCLSIQVLTIMCAGGGLELGYVIIGYLLTREILVRAVKPFLDGALYH